MGFLSCLAILQTEQLFIANVIVLYKFDRNIYFLALEKLLVFLCGYCVDVRFELLLKFHFCQLSLLAL